MLYHLLHPYASRIALANLVSYISFRAAAATVTALIIAFLVGPGIIERLQSDRRGHLPDLLRVVLHPARLRKVLRYLSIGAADRLGPIVEDEAGAPGGPLVYCEDHCARAYLRAA